MRQNKRLWFKLALALFITATVSDPSRAEEVVTLKRALTIALDRNPVLSAAQFSVASAQARVTQAVSAYLPQWNATGEYLYHRDETDLSSDDDNDTYAAGFSISQLVYDFGRTSNQIHNSRYQLNSSQSDLESVRIALIRDVKTVYFEVLKRQRLLEVSEEALQVKQRHLQQALALYQQGMRPKIDVTRSEAEVSQAELLMVQARYALQKARIALETRLGGPPVSGKYALAEVDRMLEMPEKLESLLVLAFKARPDMSNYQAQIQAAEATLLSVKRASWPSFNANGAYRFAGTDFPLNERWEAGLALKWELFTGFKRSGQISESEAGVRRLQSLLENRKLEATEEVTQAYLQVHEAIEAIRTAQTALRQAKENLDLAEGRYRAGVSNAIELSDAQVLYTQARSLLVQAVYDHLKAWAGLEFAVGGDLEKI
ncbi:MAG: TolC family protein [Pseudomonadota bacterium]